MAGTQRRGPLHSLAGLPAPPFGPKTPEQFVTELPPALLSRTISLRACGCYSPKEMHRRHEQERINKIMRRFIRLLLMCGATLFLCVSLSGITFTAPTAASSARPLACMGINVPPCN